MKNRNESSRNLQTNSEAFANVCTRCTFGYIAIWILWIVSILFIPVFEGNYRGALIFFKILGFVSKCGIIIGAVILVIMWTIQLVMSYREFIKRRP